jgi:hypothetical protein
VRKLCSNQLLTQVLYTRRAFGVAAAIAVFFNRLGEMRDRSFENQRYRASGLNLVTAAIILWNTVYVERAIQAIKDHGETMDENLLEHLSPLGWKHIKSGRRLRLAAGSQDRKGKVQAVAAVSAGRVLYIPSREATPDTISPSSAR